LYSAFVSWNLDLESSRSLSTITTNGTGTAVARGAGRLADDTTMAEELQSARPDLSPVCCDTAVLGEALGVLWPGGVVTFNTTLL